MFLNKYSIPKCVYLTINEDRNNSDVFHVSAILPSMAKVPNSNCLPFEEPLLIPKTSSDFSDTRTLVNNKLNDPTSTKLLNVIFPIPTLKKKALCVKRQQAYKNI